MKPKSIGIFAISPKIRLHTGHCPQSPRPQAGRSFSDSGIDIDIFDEKIRIKRGAQDKKEPLTPLVICPDSEGRYAISASDNSLLH